MKQEDELYYAKGANLLIVLLVSLSCSIGTRKPNDAKVDSMIRNPRCLEQNKMIITEIYRDAVFAQLCPVKFKNYYDDSFDACRDGIKIFIEVDPAKNTYVDHQKVTLPENNCFVNDGVLEYEDEFDEQMKEMVQNVIRQRTGEDIDFGETIRRVRKVRIIEAMTPRYKR